MKLKKGKGKISIYLDKDQIQELREKAARERRSLSSFIVHRLLIEFFGENQA